jgi:hypothetical protein
MNSKLARAEVLSWVASMPSMARIAALPGNEWRSGTEMLDIVVAANLIRDFGLDSLVGRAAMEDIVRAPWCGIGTLVEGQK